MTPAPIETKNLRVVPMTLQEVLAMLEALSPSEKAMVSPDWIARLQAAPSDDVWSRGFSLVHRRDNINVGHAGFTKPPGADGVVEIAYGVAPAYQGKGLATEAAQALVAFAFSTGRVRVVQAHTLPHASPSTRVLAKCGFKHIGQVLHPEDGLVWKWEKGNHTA